MLRSSTLYASECYYNLTEKEIALIESIEQDFLCKIYKTGSKCPTHLLYLEGGQVPARFLIQKYKLNYLHHIMQQDNQSTLYNFFQAQLDNPVRGDWCSEVKSYLSEMNLTFDLIHHMTKKSFSKCVDTLVHKVVL